MEIVVRIIATREVMVDMTVTPMEGRLHDPPGASRYRFAFSDDLVLERIDTMVPGHGLPEAPEDRLAGTHSGFGTTLRVGDATDNFFPEGSMLFQYEGTYMFDAVIAELPTALPKGQVIARGITIFDSTFTPLKTQTFAILGGTESYEGAKGRVTHSQPDGKVRTLTIVL